MADLPEDPIERIEAALRGEPDAVAWLYEQIAPVIRVVCDRRLRQLKARGMPVAEADYEDGRQHMYMLVLEALPNYKGKGTLKSFVASVVHRRTGDYLGRRRTRWEYANTVVDHEGNPLLDQQPAEGMGGADHIDLLPSQRARIKDALSKREFTIWTHRHDEGMEYEDIAAQLGKSTANIRVTMSICRKKLKEAFGDPEPKTCPDDGEESK